MPHPTVSIVRCEDYDLDRVRAAVREALALLPGIGGLIEGVRRVLLKPNLLSSHDSPEAAINTHPAVTHAVAEFFVERGCKVFIGDSCGSMEAGSTARAMELTGLHEVAAATGAELVDFDKAPSEEVRIPGGRVLDRVRIPKLVREVDLFVTLPKLKTHGLTLLTGAVKNQYGLMPGWGKKQTHLAAPKPADLARAVVDIFSVASPRLAVMDAIVGMEGNGPAAGAPRRVGLVLAGADAVAVDAVAAEVMGYARDEILTTAFAHERGLGVGRLDEIGLRGAPLAEVVIPDFAKPPRGVTGVMFAVLPKCLVRWFINTYSAARPVIMDDRCLVCGECVANCPAGALRESKGKIVADHSRCIGCYCCAEICKERAVEMRRPVAGRLVRGLARLVMRS